jgi:hypothetical protein
LDVRILECGYIKKIIMDSLLVIAGITVVIGLICVLFGSFLSFDELVRLEYNSYRSQWENDGKPRGFFWFPREYWNSQGLGWFDTWKSQYKSNWTMQRTNLTWLFSTPPWIQYDEKAKRLLRRLRFLVLIWNGSFVLGFISLMIIGNLR